jgi:spermidine/putrescine transport system permease protein
MGKPKKIENFYLSLVYLFIYLPIIVLFVFSFNISKLNIVWEGFTFDWYFTLLTSSNSDIMSAVWNSIVVATGTTIISTIIGTIGAIGMAKYQFTGKKILDAVLYIPIVIPEIVLGIALLSYFTTIKIPLGMTALIISHSCFCIPFVINNVRARLAGFDKSIEEASLDLGANRIQTLIKITIPIIMPGIMAGAMLSFALSMDDIIISFFVTSSNSVTLPVKILSMVRTGVTPEVNALCILLLLLSIVLVGGANLINARRDKNYGLSE